MHKQHVWYTAYSLDCECQEPLQVSSFTPYQAGVGYFSEHEIEINDTMRGELYDSIYI